MYLERMIKLFPAEGKVITRIFNIYWIHTNTKGSIDNVRGFKSEPMFPYQEAL